MSGSAAVSNKIVVNPANGCSGLIADFDALRSDAILSPPSYEVQLNVIMVSISSSEIGVADAH